MFSSTVILASAALSANLRLIPSSVSTSGGSYLYVSRSSNWLDLRSASHVRIGAGTDRLEILHRLSDANTIVTLTPRLEEGVHDVVIWFEDGNREECSRCLRASRAMVANISFAANPLLWGAAGDTIVAQISGAHELQEPFTQLTASIDVLGEPVACQVASAMQLSAGTWLAHFAIPSSVITGNYSIITTIHRRHPTDQGSHGRLVPIAAQRSAQPPAHLMTAPQIGVLPAITQLSHHVASDTAPVLLEIIGTGFSPVLSENKVTVGSEHCVIRRADRGILVCELGGFRPVQQPLSATPFHRADRGLMLATRSFKPATLKACLAMMETSLTLTALEHCAIKAAEAHGSDAIDANHVLIRDSLHWPSTQPTLLDHDGFRHDAFVARGTGTLYVPVSATYSFKFHTEEMLAEELCE